MCEKTTNDFSDFQNKSTHMTFTLCLRAFLADQRDLVANLHFFRGKLAVTTAWQEGSSRHRNEIYTNLAQKNPQKNINI